MRKFLNVSRLGTMLGRWHTYRVILALCLIASGALAQSRHFEVKELWVGTFRQLRPMPWNGKMELYLRYQSGVDDPRPISGVITWSGLGAARTMIEGHKTAAGLEFVESKCLSGACSQVVLGGSYVGQFDENYSKLSGAAKLKAKGLDGSFLLERVMLPER